MGNPGERYRSTRHNLGFRVVDRLAEMRSCRFRTDDPGALLSHVAEFAQDGRQIVLAKPQTFMNRSGEAAAALCRRYEAEPESMVVTYDDADLPLGVLKLRMSGGSGGHNGLRSLTDELETRDFRRLRLGVLGAERRGQELADYVLSPFEAGEAEPVEELIARGASALDRVLADGFVAAMNEFNVNA